MKIARSAPLCLALAAAGTAHAGRPFVTEDAGVLKRADCEWEGVIAHAKASGAPSESAWSTQLGCGIGLDSQLALAWGQARSAGSRADSIVLGGKTGLIDGGEDSPSFALAYGAAWTRADGDQRLDSHYANLVLSAPLDPDWTAHANLGLLDLHQGRATRTTWALAVEKRVAAALDLGAEFYGEGSGKPWFGVGARWQAGEKLSLNASWAWQSEAPRVSLATLGFKLEF